MDQRGRVTHMNRVAERLLGIDAGMVVGRPIDAVASLQRILLLGSDPSTWPARGSDEERAVETLDGRRLVVTSRLAELKDGQGKPAGRIEILTDLTETDRLRREVHRLDTLAALGEMAGAVAHQIRNPLNGVEGFASLLQRRLSMEGGEGKDALRFAEKIVHGVREVNAVIQGMLMLAKSEPLALKPTSIDRLAKEVVESLKSMTEGEGSSVEFEFKSNARDAEIAVDALKLKQVLLNVAHNALAALPEAGRRAIRLSTARRNGSAVIRVTDSGRGMSAQQVGKIFRPFYTTREDGTGLGLAVASKIVDLHGGAIGVRSIPGCGTTFRIEIPGCDTAGQLGDNDV
jgi:PAS domain S-box-containing protein